MVGRLGAQVGLLAFAGAVAAGLYVGNPPGTVLGRALLTLVAAVLSGQLFGWAAKLVLRDHLQRRKVALDQEHLAALRSIEDGAPATSAEGS